MLPVPDISKPSYLPVVYLRPSNLHKVMRFNPTLPQADRKPGCLAFCRLLLQPDGYGATDGGRGLEPRPGIVVLGKAPAHAPAVASSTFIVTTCQVMPFSA